MTKAQNTIRMNFCQNYHNDHGRDSRHQQVLSSRRGRRLWQPNAPCRWCPGGVLDWPLGGTWAPRLATVRGIAGLPHNGDYEDRLLLWRSVLVTKGYPKASLSHLERPQRDRKTPRAVTLAEPLRAASWASERQDKPQHDHLGVNYKRRFQTPHGAGCGYVHDAYGTACASPTIPRRTNQTQKARQGIVGKCSASYTYPHPQQQKEVF